MSMSSTKFKMNKGKRAQSHRHKTRIQSRKTRHKQENGELARLAEGLAESVDLSALKVFSDFPLSTRTLKGLEKGGYIHPTEIQREAILPALRGKDILGAAKTGSGKTLAFIIPVIETLWKERFSSNDGLGALIISPTRELAYQTFEVLRKVGCNHDMSAGLVIGGKDLKSEQRRILNTNIVICTPGRLLQHMDETPNFACDNLKMLVLDEADRILDLGFAKTMNAIIENLPSDRQTLLFSATQTKSVKDLARLSLSDPHYISVHENSEYVTPKKLNQSYVVLELQDKLNFLYSFLRNHTQNKILVFLSSCKQVKFIFEAFKKLRPGIPLMALYGKQKQLKRVAIYNDFCKKSAAALLATDIAARGLDFPAVHWVVQLDCPEDTDTYVHRAGRTARYEKDGQAILVLIPSEEEAMIKELQERRIPIEEIRANPSKMQDVQKKLSAFCAQSQELKHWAQRSVVSYVRSVFLHSNKNIFDVNKLNIEEFARSLGLLAPPRIRFMKKLEKRVDDAKEKEKDRMVDAMMKDLGMDTTRASDDERNDEKHRNATIKSHSMKSQARITKTKSEHSAFNDENNDDDLLVLKRRHIYDDQQQEEDADLEIAIDQRPQNKNKPKVISRTVMAKKIVRKGIKLNTKVVFDDKGEPLKTEGVQLEKDEFTSAVEPVSLEESMNVVLGGIDIDEHKELMKKEDKMDRKRERDRIKEKHKKKRIQLRQERKAMATGIPVVQLPTFDDGLEERDIDEDSDVESHSDATDEDNIKEIRNSTQPPIKKKKRSEATSLVEKQTSLTMSQDSSLMDDEELALRLLSQPR